ncbi:MAG: ECF transporter S component [Oscillospiraceae bacterium]|jgi:hypothetical protein|nr:ECF transporter S component [Oscillospiraceae bacterium]
MKTRNNVKALVLASLLLALAIILQLVQRNFTQINPLLIGPLINTTILLTTYFCGLTYGLMISVLIPVLAIPTGALAAPLIPFSPFIVVANLIYAASFYPLMKKGKFGIYIGALLSSVLRFLFFALSAMKLLYVFIPDVSKKSAQLIGACFTTPQLLIALLGSAVAIIVIKLLRKRKITV